MDADANGTSVAANVSLGAGGGGSRNGSAGALGALGDKGVGVQVVPGVFAVRTNG